MSAMTVSFDSADAVELMVNKLRDLVQKVEADNRYLVRENASLWATVREREDELKEANEAIEELRAMVQRAHTEPTR